MLPVYPLPPEGKPQPTEINNSIIQTKTFATAADPHGSEKISPVSLLIVQENILPNRWWHWRH